MYALPEAGANANERQGSRQQHCDEDKRYFPDRQNTNSTGCEYTCDERVL